MEKNIALIKGDGIGPEVVDSTLAVLDRICEKYSHKFTYTENLMGGIAIDTKGEPLPKETIENCKKADSVLLGAVGGPKWDNLPGNKRPEAGLLGIRGALGLYCNLRPALLFSALADACPLKDSITGREIDILIVRELTGGIYFGEKGRENEGNTAYDVEKYSVEEIERIGRSAFEMARKRRKKICSVDKANVLESSRLWRETMHRVKEDYPDVEYCDMFVDNAAMQLIRDPNQFDVIVTSNIFGDILSDEASMLTGSIGLLPSASLSQGTFGLYEPIHGSAPDIAGSGKANPIATILSAAMMLRYSFDMKKEADDIENAVKKALDEGARTADIARGEKFITTKEMTDLIIKNI